MLSILCSDNDHLEISGKDSKDLQSEKIADIFRTRVIFHLDISGNDCKDSQN